MHFPRDITIPLQASERLRQDALCDVADASLYFHEPPPPALERQQDEQAPLVADLVKHVADGTGFAVRQHGVGYFEHTKYQKGAILRDAAAYALLPDMKRILVTGATGNLGRAVVTALKNAGFNIRAAARNPSKVTADMGVEPMLFAYENPATHAAALQGEDGLFLIAPPLDAEVPAKLNPFIDRAKARGVRHIVLTSALGVDAVEQAPLRIVERHLMASGVPYTILRPNFFMENFSTGFLAPMLKQGGIFLAAADGKTSFISVADIAEVAAVAFQKGLASKEYNLTGPEALDHAQVAAIIAEVSGKKINYQAISEEAMLSGLRGTGMPEGAVQYVGVLYAAVRAGYTAVVTNDVESVTNRRPISFETFARQSEAAWR